jgi:hypothetical protein
VENQSGRTIDAIITYIGLANKIRQIGLAYCKNPI